MKRFVPVLLLLLPLLLPAVPAAAGEGFYLGGHYGVVLLDESENTDSQGRFNLDFENGRMMGGVLGYSLVDHYPQLGTGRVELELTQRRNDLEEAGFRSGTVPAGGELEVLSVMLNTFGEYRDRAPWVPYAGLGAGYAVVRLKDATVTGEPLADDEDRVFAYQAGAGLGLELGDHLALDLGYRFFATLDPEFEKSDGSRFDSEYFSHNFTLGMRVIF